MTASNLGNLPIERLSECPKTMTNGPCGGVGLDGTCEVDRTKLCVWHEALKDSPATETRKLAPAPDWTQDFSATFATLPTTEVIDIAALAHKNDRPLHTGSRFEQLLRAGHFVITAELNPPDSADLTSTLDYANTIRNHIDACHISDNALAQPHMNGIATAALVQQVGIEPILHMACRDRNRLALQADMLGAHALGVRNLLCLTGDHPSQGDHPQGKPVFDVDALASLQMARRLRDEGRFWHGERELSVRPRLFLGGAAGPTAPPLDYRPYRMAKKIAAGADFIVTQLVFDMNLFRQYWQRVRDLGLDEKAHILVGVGALTGAAMAEMINRETPGVVIPPAIIQRLEGVLPQQRKAEGIRIVVEQIQELREMPGINGLDIMDLDMRHWFPTVEIVEAAGLMPRPRLTPSSV